MNTTQKRQTEFLKKASAALKAQGRPSLVASRKTCAYLGEGGDRCAVGHILPAESHVATFEGMSIARMVRVLEGGEGHGGAERTQRAHALKAALEASGAREDDFAFLASLQHAHDTAANPGVDFWRTYHSFASNLAQRFGLDASVIPG